MKTDEPLLHFTSEANMTRILSSGKLCRGRSAFGVYPIPPSRKEAHRSVCFTSVSPQESTRLARKKGQWGIAFSRAALVKSGAREVKYVKDLARIRHQQSSCEHDDSAPIWRESPYLSPSAIPGKYEYEYEKEWRLNDDYSFDWNDIEYLIAPHGGELKIVEENNLGSFTFADDDGNQTLEWNDGDSKVFNLIMENATEQLKLEYRTPDEAGLPLDREDETGYYWVGLTPHDPCDIISDSIPVLPDSLKESLMWGFASSSQYWVSESELCALEVEISQEQEDTSVTNL